MKKTLKWKIVQKVFLLLRRETTTKIKKRILKKIRISCQHQNKQKKATTTTTKYKIKNLIRSNIRKTLMN